jgi:hypothetical protein
MNCGFPGLRLPVAPLLASDTAKVLAALTGHQPLNRQPPETSVKSEDLLESKRLNTAEAARRKPSCQGRIKEENP